MMPAEAQNSYSFLKKAISQHPLLGGLEAEVNLGKEIEKSHQALCNHLLNYDRLDKSLDFFNSGLVYEIYSENKDGLLQLDCRKNSSNLDLKFNKLVRKYKSRKYLEDKDKMNLFRIFYDPGFRRVIRKVGKLVKDDVISRKKDEKIGDNSFLDEYLLSLNQNLRQSVKLTNNLFYANLRLALSNAVFFNKITGFDQGLLESAALEGLYIAVEKYDYRRSNKFSTFATFWIKQKIYREIAVGMPLIYMGCHAAGDLIACLKNVESNLSETEILNHIMSLAGKRGKQPETLVAAYYASKAPIYYDSFPIKFRENFLHGNSEDINETDCFLEKMTLEKTLNNILSKLHPREEGILRMRFGLLPYDRAHTLDEVKVGLNITRERVRQIEQKAMDKLRKKGKFILEEFIK